MHVAKRSKDATLLRIDFGSAAVRRQAADASSSPSTSSTRASPPNRQVRVGTEPRDVPGVGVRLGRREGQHASRSASRPATTCPSRAATSTAAPRATDGGVTLSTRAARRAADVLRLPSRPSARRSTRTSPLQVDAGGRDRRPRRSAAGATTRPGPSRIGGLFTEGAAASCADEIGLPWPRDEPTRRPGGREPGGRRLRRAVRPGRAADRGRLLGRPAGRRSTRRRTAGSTAACVADRWASEGFASLYAQRRGRQAQGPRRRARSSPPRAGKAAIPLNAWPNTAGDDGAGPTAPRRRTATRPPSRSPARSRSAPGTTRSSASGRRRAHGVGAYQPEPAGAGDGGDARRARDGRRPARLARPARPPRGRDRQGLHRPVARVGRPPRGGGAARRPRGRADLVRADARARRRLAAPARHPRRHARVAVRRGSSSCWPTRGPCSRSAARSSRSPHRGRLTLPADVPARVPGGRHGRARRPRRRRSATRCSRSCRPRTRRVHDDDLLSRDRDAGRGSRGRTSRRPGRRSRRATSRAPSRRRTTRYRAWTSAWQEGRRRALLGRGRPRRGALVLVAAVAVRARAGAPRADGLDRRGLLTAPCASRASAAQSSDRPRPWRPPPGDRRVCPRFCLAVLAAPRARPPPRPVAPFLAASRPGGARRRRPRRSRRRPATSSCPTNGVIQVAVDVTVREPEAEPRRRAARSRATSTTA